MQDTGGPLPIPRPANPTLSVKLQESLSGHATSEAWLPAGLWEELDTARDEQLRLRAQLVKELSALHELATQFQAEDRKHAEALREAQRAGTPDAVKDARTSDRDREVQRNAVLGRVFAAAEVMAEVADQVIGLVRAREDQWLSDLREQVAPAVEKRVEAQRLLDEARATEWRLARLGQWIQQTSDGEYGRQPAPKIEPVPAGFNVASVRDALERPWHKRRQWNRSPEEALS